MTFASRTSGPVGSECQIRSTSCDSYPTTLSKDSLSRICPRNNRPDSRAPLQSLVGRPSSILRSPRTVGKGARLASDFTAKARLGNVSLRAEKGGIICKKAAIMGATARRLPRRPHRRRHRKCPARKGLNVGRIVCPTQLKSYSRLHSSSRRRFGLSLSIGSLPAQAAGCEDLIDLKIPATTIRIAQSTPAGDYTASDKLKYANMPAFCRVLASVKPAPDSDIEIEMWLPKDGWKGVFHGNGNGGFGGTLASGGIAAGVKRGYASATTDMGTAPSTQLNGGIPLHWPPPASGKTGEGFRPMS